MIPEKMSRRTEKLRICYVVCYKDPNYIRTQVLISALHRINNLEVIVIKNKNRGILRYIEVPLRLMWTRITKHPDYFIVGFRGHEVFWMLYPSMVGKKIIFDEFINLHDWLISEHKKIKEDSWVANMTDKYIKWVHGRCYAILEDTEAHKKLSENIYGTPPDKIYAVPVGADEAVFTPRKAHSNKGEVEVFFFGNLWPLQGLDVMLGAIKILVEKNEVKGLHFTFAGGRGNATMSKQIDDFISKNNLDNHFTHLDWLPYDNLPEYIANADVCLGGPFGDTAQAKRVITGKTYQYLAMGKATIIGEGENKAGFIDHQNCILVPQGSSEHLAAALEWSKGHQEELHKIGVEGKKLYDSKFSINNISNILEGILVG